MRFSITGFVDESWFRQYVLDNSPKSFLSTKQIFDLPIEELYKKCCKNKKLIKNIIKCSMIFDDVSIKVGGHFHDDDPNEIDKICI